MIRSSIMLTNASISFSRAIQDLNLLQSNTQTLALAKYKAPQEILPLFKKQLDLAGINVEDLDTLKIIHVSGTKGKGSTCAFIESILRASGKKTGFYNSPHLVKVTERIKINGAPIADEKFSRYFHHVYDRLQHETKREGITMPSYFSFLTILAFHIFLEEKVNCALIEVGMGGEYDPTNIIRRPIACGITTLDYDHTNILGTTIESIAWSKAGIAKRGVPLFTVEQEQDEALKVFELRAREKQCPLIICKPPRELPKDFQLGIRGSAQTANASLACQLAKYFLGTTSRSNGTLNSHIPPIQTQLETDLSEMPAFFLEALQNCSWPGRCQVVKYSRITFFLDGAHTKKSMENCIDWFQRESYDDSIDAEKILMVNVIGDRNKMEVLRPLSHYKAFKLVIFSTNKIDAAHETSKSDTFSNLQGPNSDKSMENVHTNVDNWNCLLKEQGVNAESKIVIKPNTSDSINYINELTKLNPDRKYHALVTGSLHFVGAILKTLSIVDNLD